MATITWDGSESGGVFTDDANWVGGVAPADGDSIVFDGTSDGATGNDCTINALTISSSEQYHDITIASTYTGIITFSNTLDVRLDGALLVHKANTLKGTGTTTFTFLGAPSVDTYDGAGAAYTKALVNFTADTSVWNAGRDTFTFNFGSQTFSMVDGAYPNITYTGEMKAKKIYSDASRTDFNNYGSVDMLNFNGDDITSSDYDIYDYTKEFLFEGTLTAIGEFFRFGHTTARFKTLKTSSYGALNFPVTGSTNFGNTTTKNFYAQYHKLVIETNDVIDNYWLIPAGLTIECNELVIKDGGRIYGEVGTDAKAATIKCVKRPTIRGDWNMRQIADGVYETIGAISNTPVYHGGTGRQTLTKNALLYGNGMDDIGQLSLGSAGDVLAVNSGATGIEWSSTGGTNISIGELEDVSITSAAEQEILRYDATAGEWINDTHDRNFLRVKAAEALSKGDVVFIFAVHNSNVVKVKKARADSTSTMPAIGIMYETLALNAEGLAVVLGKTNGVAANYTEGEIMYVSPTTAGTITNTKPTSGSHLIQNVGILMKAHASNAVVKLTTVGRTNDIPNATITTNSADADYVYIDDGNVWKKITPTNLGIANTFVIVGEESDDYITSTAAAGNTNGYQFSYGNGAQNTTKSSTGSDFGVMIPVACTLSRLDFTFGNIGNEDNASNQTITVYKNAASTTTTVTFNCNGSGGNTFTKSFSSLSGNGLSYSAGDRFNLRTTGLSGYTNTQIGPARMTAYFTVA